MANSITGNPWKIDSTGTLLSQRFKFDGGIWTGTAAAQVFTLTDLSGRIVFTTVYPTDLQPVQIPKMGWVNGLICTVIGGGTALIYVGNK